MSEEAYMDALSTDRQAAMQTDRQTEQTEQTEQTKQREQTKQAKQTDKIDKDVLTVY